VRDTRRQGAVTRRHFTTQRTAYTAHGLPNMAFRTAGM